jgi:hypothetical protein
MRVTRRKDGCDEYRSGGKRTGAERFSHVREGDTPYETGGLRDFFLYRDLGIAAPPVARW